MSGSAENWLFPSTIGNPTSGAVADFRQVVGTAHFASFQAAKVFVVFVLGVTDQPKGEQNGSYKGNCPRLNRVPQQEPWPQRTTRVGTARVAMRLMLEPEKGLCFNYENQKVDPHLFVN